MFKNFNLSYSLLLVLLFISTLSSAQFYSQGQDPFSTNWKQINSENFQVIFPAEYELQANDIANMLEFCYENVSESMEHKPRKVSVIVHNQTVRSNGFVSWAPGRIELFTQSPADNETDSWMERLVIHEYRHVVQIDKLNQGVTKLLSILFGEAGTGAVLGLHVPLWFMEGDAVVTETAFTHSGRGRMPEFEQGLRAQVLNLGAYSYEKAMFGSYKDFVDDHYKLGYFLTANARREYGKNIWSEAMNYVARNPWRPGAFSAGVKKQTGNSSSNYYLNTFNYLDSVWRDQHKQYPYTGYIDHTPDNKLYAKYKPVFPISGNESGNEIVALKTGLKEPPKVVLIKDGEEKTLFRPGNYFPDAFHYSAGKIIWSEYQPHPRWAHKSWSVIMIYNLDTGKKKKITRKSRIFSPALSPDGLKIAAVEYNDKDLSSLIIMDINGAELQRFSFIGKDIIQQPSWNKEGTKIVYTATNEEGKRLEILDLATNVSVQITQPTFQEFSNPVFKDEHIVYSGTFSGIDNIYQTNISTGETHQIISSEFGAVMPYYFQESDKIFYSQYTEKGYQIASTDISQLESQPLGKVQNHSANLYKYYTKQENPPLEASTMPEKKYETKKYSRLNHLFHAHSWVPTYANVETVEAQPGASLLFQNMLSTSFATIGYGWDINDQTGSFKGEYTYEGFFPVIDMGAQFGNRRIYYTDNEQEKNFIVNQGIYDLGVSLPLQWEQNAHFLIIRPSVTAGIEMLSRSNSTPETITINGDQYSNLSMYTQQYGVYATRQSFRVMRDIYPRFGQTINLLYNHTPWFEDEPSDIFVAQGILFFPGLFAHHGLRLSASRQVKTRGTQLYGNYISYPRGISLQSHREVNAFTADYVFPVFYPDWRIKYLLYLMRVRASFFGDYANTLPFEDSSQQGREELYSYGFSLVGDMHFFRLSPRFSLGVQVSFTSMETIDYQMIASFSIN